MTTAGTNTQGVSLQCGHDPKAVENIEKSVDQQAEPPLQCGHDPKAVENEVDT